MRFSRRMNKASHSNLVSVQGETSMQAPLSPRYFLALLTCALLFAPTQASFAAAPGGFEDHTLMLAVDQSVLEEKEGLSERAHQRALRELTEEVANRMEVRLLAAGIRSKAEALPRGRVKLTARSRKPRHHIEGIITGGGLMELRPDIDQTFVWSGLGGILPNTIELRETSHGTIAWSAEREPLSKFAAKLALELFDRHDRRLAVQRIEHRFDQNEIGPARDQRPHKLHRES